MFEKFNHLVIGNCLEIPINQKVFLFRFIEDPRFCFQNEILVKIGIDN